MAEDGGETEDYEDVNIEEGRQSTQKKQPGRNGYKDKRCNARLDELAKPKKWLMLATWNEHRGVFDPLRVQALKERIQEEFSMTPEETEVYFNQLRRQARRMLNKKALAKQVRREKAYARESAYRIFKKLLRKAMKQAFMNPPPPIVSPMVRETSNKILDLLCEIHGVDVMPKRESTDKKNLFLIYLADWAAILLANIYYEVNVNEKVETERFNKKSESSLKTGEEEGEEEEGEEEEEGKSKPGKGITDDEDEEDTEQSTKPDDPLTETEEPRTDDESAPEEDIYQPPEQ